MIDILVDDTVADQGLVKSCVQHPKEEESHLNSKRVRFVILPGSKLVSPFAYTGVTTGNKELMDHFDQATLHIWLLKTVSLSSFPIH